MSTSRRWKATQERARHAATIRVRTRNRALDDGRYLALAETGFAEAVEARFRASIASRTRERSRR